MATVSELLSALPTEEHSRSQAVPDEFEKIFTRLERRPVPIGRLHRFWRLGGLHAQVAVAYTFYWIRGWFKKSDEKDRQLMETHLRISFKLLETMGYMRGAVMKIGQTLANFPDIVPDQLVNTLEKLHFEAPPMHYSLLREQLCSELGGDPEEIFDEFETTAFAAASLGQVHRARLKTGEKVAVKVQYPGIARTIRSDFRNLLTLLIPARLSREWDNGRRQLEEVRHMLEQETDYEREARILSKARSLFAEDDGIVVPRVYPQYSTRRVLTMDLLGGVHLDDYLSLSPAQEERNEFAKKIFRAWVRLYYSGRMSYIDWHPGNFLFQEGKLGWIDFGCVGEMQDEEWECHRKGDYARTSGKRKDIADFVVQWCEITDDDEDRDRLERSVEYCEHVWKPSIQKGVFDYSNVEDLKHTIKLLGELTKKRYTRGRSTSPLITRWELAYRTMFYRLGAKIDVNPISDEEARASGWPHVN